MPSDPFYWSHKWRATRSVHLKDNPYCAVCAAIYLRVPAIEVDHVIAKERVEDPFDHANLRSLCKQHHGQKTALTEGRNRKGGKRFQVIGEDGWPVPYGENDGNDQERR